MVRSCASAKSDQTWNLLLATADLREGVRSTRQPFDGITLIFSEARLEDGLIVVPGFSDGELLCPSAGRFSKGGKITPVGGTKDLFGERFGMSRGAVPCDHRFWGEFCEAGKTCRNDRQARREGFHQGNRQTFIDRGEHEEIESGEKTGDIETGAVKEDTTPNSQRFCGLRDCRAAGAIAEDVQFCRGHGLTDHPKGSNQCDVVFGGHQTSDRA